MTNPLYLPELRDYLAKNNEAELREFCTALHAARTAEFMEGLDPRELWAVLKHAEPLRRVEVFTYLDGEVQVAVIEDGDRTEMGQLIADLPADDRVDILKQVDPQVVDELLPLIPADERRDILRLRAYPEGTAGAVMTTEFARLSENLTAGQALDEVRRQAEQLETIYYLYVVDDADHLRGLVSLRQLLTKPDMRVGDLMERDVVTVGVTDDQEDVAQELARFDFLAIPVVDSEHRILGIITHDDVMDVVRDEATEDAHRIAAVEPLREGYLETHLLTLTWKRGIWLTILCVGALLTAVALKNFEETLEQVVWLVLFVPLVISTGGNSGSQSATLIITALTRDDVELGDWFRVAWRELVQGILLGAILGAIGYGAALLIPGGPSAFAALVVPITVLLTVMCGTLLGSLLPLMFQRLGLDPALMSSPFLAGIIDILGILIYMTVALSLLDLD